MKKSNDIKAVALRYDHIKETAPRVLAKGKGSTAENIIQKAQEYNIHIQEDPALIELLTKIEINQQIPEELYGVVAEIFAFIYKVDKDL